MSFEIGFDDVPKGLLYGTQIFLNGLVVQKLACLMRERMIASVLDVIKRCVKHNIPHLVVNTVAFRGQETWLMVLWFLVLIF